MNKSKAIGDMIYKYEMKFIITVGARILFLIDFVSGRKNKIFWK